MTQTLTLGDTLRRIGSFSYLCVTGTHPLLSLNEVVESSRLNLFGFFVVV